MKLNIHHQCCVVLRRHSYHCVIVLLSECVAYILYAVMQRQATQCRDISVASVADFWRGVPLLCSFVQPDDTPRPAGGQGTGATTGGQVARAPVQS